MGLNDINSLSQSLPLRVYKMELQISHRVCAKISKESHLWKNQSGHWENIKEAV